MLLNNMCEVLNGQLLDGRDRPIISTLEYARDYMMKRIVKVKQLQAKCDGPLTPTATKLFQAIKYRATEYTATWNGGHLYGVTGPWQNQHVVNVLNRTCTCRMWELTGMPSAHAVAVNWNMAANRMEVGLPESWVHPCYRLDTWRAAYSYHINPIRGKILWPKSTIPTTIIPPNHHPQIGRPQKKRKKSLGEDIPMVNNGKLSRKSKTVTCKLCKNKGHNKRSCKGATTGGSKTTKSANVGAKRKKTTDGSSASNVDARKKKAVHFEEHSQTAHSTKTQASQTVAANMRKNKGKAVADSSQASGKQVKRSNKKVLKLG
jgi:hypothetical protein